MKRKPYNQNRQYVKRMNNYFRSLRLNIQISNSSIKRSNSLIKQNKRTVELEKQSVRINRRELLESLRLFKRWKKTEGLK